MTFADDASPPDALAGLNPDTLLVGLDVGGTSMKLGLVTAGGQTLAADEIDTDEPAGPRANMQRAMEAVDRMLGSIGRGRSDVAAIGLGTPGPQDIRTGMLIQPPNHPHWHNFPIVNCLETISGRPVVFHNDANAAAWGEFWLGSGRDVRSMVMLALGTGVGGGVIVDERLMIGNSCAAGELGHIVVDGRPNARLCTWGGGRGHLEAYASASAVAAIAAERVEAGETTNLPRGVRINGRVLYEAALEDDPLAMTLIDETASWLAVGITSIVHTLDPGRIVIGGAMTFGGPSCEIGRRFLHRIRYEYRGRSFPYIADATQIEFASLGGDAGYLGAAGLAGWHLLHGML